MLWEIFPSSHCFSPRRQVRVDQIFVHENYTSTGSKANDIALLRLGEILFPVLGKSFPLNISKLGTLIWEIQTHPSCTKYSFDIWQLLFFKLFGSGGSYLTTFSKFVQICLSFCSIERKCNVYNFRCKGWHLFTITYEICMLYKDLFNPSLTLLMQCNLSCIALFSEERVDLSLFSPVCLPTKSRSFEGNVGHIYGGLDTCLIVKKHTFCRLGVNRRA